MKLRLLRLLTGCVLFSTGSVYAAEYVSVKESNAILYDAPSVKAKKLFVVNRYMPLEQVVVLDSWVKVRDKSGGLYWVEKRLLSSTRYVFTLLPLVDVLDQPADGATRVFQVRQQIALNFSKQRVQVGSKCVIKTAKWVMCGAAMCGAIKLRLSNRKNHVIPAQAGIQMINKSPQQWDNTMVLSASRRIFYCWIPAFAGMTA